MNEISLNAAISSDDLLKRLQKLANSHGDLTVRAVCARAFHRIDAVEDKLRRIVSEVAQFTDALSEEVAEFTDTLAETLNDE